MKLTGKELLHKLEIGGVVTNIWNDDHAHAAYEKLSAIAHSLRLQGKQVDIQLQQQIQDGIELIV